MATVLSDRYRLEELLASGGMGAVWRAVDLRLDRTVAVKVLASAFADDADFVARFRAEALTMAAVRHPNIVGVYDHGEDGGQVYLVMEFVAGKPLSQVLEERGRLPADEALPIIAQAATALQVAHDAGIVHRDVKPSNLLIEDDGTVRLADFGVARSAASAGLTATQKVLGTALYMAPEQAMGQGVTPAADIYALGAVAYHCLAGGAPFGGETPVEVALHHVQDEPPPLPADVPEPARWIVQRAMNKDPLQRFESAAALAEAAAAPPSETVVMPAAVSRRPRGRLAAGVGAGAVALAATAALVLSNMSGGPLETPMLPSGSVQAPQPSQGGETVAPSTRRPTTSTPRGPGASANPSPTPSRTNSPSPTPADSPTPPAPTPTPTTQASSVR